MAPEKPVASSDAGDETDLAKAFQEVAKGERAAAALENQLSQMEARIEALLAQAEKEQQEVHEVKQQKASSGASKPMEDSRENRSGST
ncbi:hypothetical protein B0A55_08907 [Lecanosticta acicola]|uniref:Uncharacterized protein n=1 Tax=Lecanosticta acicola TaxID=111012 RepID=A0AAI8YYP7_9PEZI|nr:hypothetical protein B0A55_08907 [Lecanosticta acicola]